MLFVGAYFYFEGGAYMSTDDAYIEADKVGLSTDVSGMVEAIEVRENQHITAGQILFRLDPLPFQFRFRARAVSVLPLSDQMNRMAAAPGCAPLPARPSTRSAVLSASPCNRSSRMCRPPTDPQTRGAKTQKWPASY